MRTIEEIANSTGNGMTDREKTICILSMLKADRHAAGVLCGVMKISQDVASQAALDISRFSREATEVVVNESK